MKKLASSAGNSVCPTTQVVYWRAGGLRCYGFPVTRPRNPPAHTLHREPVLITELCDTDVTEITELPAEEAMKKHCFKEIKTCDKKAII